MPSISVLPAYPVPGKSCRLTATATAGGNAVRVWCTNAPPGSRLRKQLDDSQAGRLVVEPSAESGRPFEFTPDEGGGYVLLLEELQRGSGFGGGYEGDPRGAPSEEILESATATVYVATAVSCRLGFSQDTATLRLFVAGANIIATTKDQHGAVTPAIELAAQATAKARSAAESPNVRAALAELIGAATTALGSPGDVIAGLIGKYEGHRVRDSLHANADAANAVSDASYASLSSIAGQREALAKLREGLGRHIRNVDPDAQQPVTGSANYHANISWSAVPIEALAASGDPNDLMVVIADTWRAYDAHRSSSTAHSSRDLNNAPVSLPPLLNLHRRFLEQLASTTPATPPTDHSALALLANAAGFKDS